MMLVFFLAAHAQGLSLAGETIAPLQPSSGLIGPIDEGDALVFFGRDIETQTPRSIRLTAASAVAELGLPVGALSVRRCGGQRWTLQIAQEDGATRYRALGPEIAWSRIVPSGTVPTVSMGCAGDSPFIAWVEAGILAVQPLGSASRVLPFQTMLWNASTQGHLRIEARGEVFYALADPWDGPAALLRIVGGQIAHRRDLGVGEPTALTLTESQALIAVRAPDRAVQLQGFSLADLTPGQSARITPTMPNGQLTVAPLAVGPHGLVSVQSIESWIGDDYVAIPQGPNEPDRYEPAYHSATALRLFTPATGALGPPIDRQRRYAGACAWIGEHLVTIDVVESLGVSGGVVQLRPAHVRRYAVVR